MRREGGASDLDISKVFEALRAVCFVCWACFLRGKGSLAALGIPGISSTAWMLMQLQLQE